MTADGGLPVDRVDIGDQSLQVAVASTPDQRSQGLRGVVGLDGYDGMLFVFEDPRTATFGMGDTLIPLDIWWFDTEGLLVGSAEMEPCPDLLCPSYGSPGVIGWALETPAGEFQFTPGDELVFP